MPFFADIAEPLYKLEHKDIKWVWTVYQDDAFNKLRNELLNYL